MSSKRSKIWTSKRKELLEKESELRGELDEASDEIESQVKNIAKAAIVVGGVFLISYGLYRAFRKKERYPEPVVEPTLEPKAIQPPTHYPTVSFKRIFMERLASTVVKVVGAQLALILAQKMGTKASEEEEED